MRVCGTLFNKFALWESEKRYVTAQSFKRQRVIYRTLFVMNDTLNLAACFGGLCYYFSERLDFHLVDYKKI